MEVGDRVEVGGRNRAEDIRSKDGLLGSHIPVPLEQFLSARLREDFQLVEMSRAGSVEFVILGILAVGSRFHAHTVVNSVRRDPVRRRQRCIHAFDFECADWHETVHRKSDVRCDICLRVSPKQDLQFLLFVDVIWEVGIISKHAVRSYQLDAWVGLRKIKLWPFQ